MMRWVVLLLFLASCVVVEPEVTVYTPEVVQSVQPVDESPSFVNDSIESDYIPVLMDFTEGNYTAPEVVVDLSLSEQHKLIPLLEFAVKNSSCYNVSWIGMENYSEAQITERQELRFEYLGGQKFKGWVFSELILLKEQVASGTNAVMVENLVVECIDEPVFNVDWRRVDAKLAYLQR